MNVKEDPVKLNSNDYIFTSTKAARFKLDDGWVFYAPDFYGMPIVGGTLINQIFESFQGGSISQHVLDLLTNLMGYKYAEVVDCINFLLDKGILKSNNDAGRYKSTNYQSAENVEVWLHINNSCNLKCDYCFVDKDKSFMTDEVMARTIENLSTTAKTRNLKQLTIKFAGGEPTLVLDKMESFYEQLSDKLADSETKLNVGILSNGTVLSDQLIRFIKKNNAGISISLDGYGEEGHDIYRTFKNNPNRGSWNLIYKNINQLLSHGIKPYILATISEESCKTLTSLVQWIMQNNLSTRLGIVRTPTILRENASQAKEQAYESLCQTMIEAFEQVFIELEKPTYPFNIVRKIGICELHFERPSFTTCCGIGNNHIVINENGFLANCPMTLKETLVSPGKDLLLSTRKTFPISPEIRNSESKKNCLDCNWFPVCVSGCPINNSRNTGNLFSISPLHEFYDYVIPRFIKFYGQKLLQHAKINNITNYHVLNY